MSDLDRRDFLRLASGLAAGLATGGLSGCTSPSASPDGQEPREQRGRGGGIDYARAKATPTICFGCTTHCGVIG